MARKRSSEIQIENYVNGSPITPGVTYKLGDADTHTAWLLASSSPCLFKLSATAPTDEQWSNVTPEEFIINGSVAGQVIEIESPDGKYFVVPTNAQDKNASVESAHATIALRPLGFDYDQEYQALPLDGDGPVSEGFYKISNLESGKLYSINVHPDLGGLMETKPNPEFSYALFSVGADNNPKAFLAGGKTTDQLVFVATETSAILSLGSTIEEAGYFVSIRNFSLGSGEGGGSGTGFDPASDQTISGAWSFTNTAGLVLGNEVPLVLGQGVDAVKIHGDGSGAAVIEGTDASHMDVAIPVKFQNPTTFDDGISFVATTGEKMKCILFGKESGPTRVILYEESNGFLSITDPNNVNNKTLTIDGNGDLWVYKNENHNGVVTFNSQTRMHGTIDVGGVMTFRKTPNANSGINIPLAAGAQTDTAAVSRAYALGMAHAAMMHQTRTYWVTSSCTATNGVAINHIAPGCYCEAILAANIRTSVTLPSAGALGGGNYSKIAGYSLPVKFSGGSEGSAFKISMIIGGSGQFEEYPDAGIDDFRLRPVVGSAADITRLVDVTLYYDNGYKARVRELIGIGSPKRYVVRTTLSNLDYNSNTNPCSATYRVVIAQSEIGHGDALAAGVWMVMGGLSNDTIIKLADIRCWDTYHVLYAPVIYLDAQAGLYGGVISAESPTIINGVGGNTYVRFGLEPYQRSWITSATEEPYTEQPTEL